MHKFTLIINAETAKVETLKWDDYLTGHDIVATDAALAVEDSISPEIDVAYKDRMKPSNWEGRILFHFNGLQKKIDDSIQVKTVLK